MALIAIRDFTRRDGATFSRGDSVPADFREEVQHWEHYAREVATNYIALRRMPVQLMDEQGRVRTRKVKRNVKRDGSVVSETHAEPMVETREVGDLVPEALWWPMVETREVGDLVPEALWWPNVQTYVNQGWIRAVTLDPETEALREENEALRARVAELEAEVAEAPAPEPQPAPAAPPPPSRTRRKRK